MSLQDKLQEEREGQFEMLYSREELMKQLFAPRLHQLASCFMPYYVLRLILRNARSPFSQVIIR